MANETVPFIVVATCKSCGAPKWSPADWQTVCGPPPVYHGCWCAAFDPARRVQFDFRFSGSPTDEVRAQCLDIIRTLPEGKVQKARDQLREIAAAAAEEERVFNSVMAELD